MMRFAQHVRVLVLAVAAVTVASIAPAAAAANGVAATRPAPLVAGHWTYFKAESLDGRERNAVMTVTKGGTWIERLAVAPVGACTGPRITVLGRQRVKVKKIWYVGTTPTASIPVTVIQAAKKSQAGLLVDANSSRDVEVTLNAPSTTGGCIYTFQLHRVAAK